MKIGLICPYSLQKGGGVQECVLAMQAELTARGHTTHIITPQPRDQTATLPKFVHTLGRMRDVKSPFHTTAQVSVSVDTKQVDNLLTSEKFDVLHFHEPWVPLLSRQILMRSQSKNIATFHAKLPDTVMSRTIEKVITPYTRSVLKYFDTLTAPSESAASYVRTLTDSSVEIIANGIDLAKYATASVARPANNTILYIGRLEKRKGVIYLLKAVAQLTLAFPEIKLVIAGDGPDREQLQKKAAELGINADFLGRVDEKTKLKLLATAQVFCSPALFGESFGIVLLEAMACGLPVVAGDNPGYSGVMAGTGKISLVNSSDADELARRLDIMLHDQAIRKVWQTWAAKEVKQYDYKLIVDKYEEIYKR